jgi:hypothetical protein
MVPFGWSGIGASQPRNTAARRKTKPTRKAPTAANHVFAPSAYSAIRDHTEGDILAATPLDPPRGAVTDRVCVEQQSDHHLRVKRSTTPAIGAIDAVDGPQVDLLDRVKHAPREVILLQPIAQARRQQQLLLTVTRDEVLRHHRPPVLGNTAIV